MLALDLLIFALLALIPLAASGALMIRAVRQSSRGPPQWAGTISSRLAPGKGPGKRAS
jgi:hypothetical protein